MGKATRDPIDRFVEKVEFTADCWEYRGRRDKRGYGVFNVGGVRALDVHHFDWEVEATIYGTLAVHPETRPAREGEEPTAVHFAEGRYAVTHVATGRDVITGNSLADCERFASRWGAHPWWATVAAGPIDPADVPPDLWMAVYPFVKVAAR